MKTTNLHEEFIAALYAKVPKRADLVNKITDILHIEKESASRRLGGKVNFSVQEVGRLANAFNISLDQLLRKDSEYLWIPFLLESPLKLRSMDALCDIVDVNIGRLKEMKPSQTGNVYNVLPLEFYMYSPTLAKFMFFKWGHYFVGTDEFNNFSQWELPPCLANVHEELESIYNFDKAFYIWDNTLIWTLVREIDNFYRMHVITTEERNAIASELKDVLDKIEKTLNGTYIPHITMARELSFYVSSMSLGFTSSYFASEDKYSISFLTNFSFASVDDCYESFVRFKEWLDSLRNVSILLSQSGRIERRLFFETQQMIIDQTLK